VVVNETSVCFYQSKQCYIAGDGRLYLIISFVRYLLILVIIYESNSRQYNLNYASSAGESDDEESEGR
jgi:hypothetical protein